MSELNSVVINRRVLLSNLQEEKIIVEQNDLDKSVFAPIYKKANSLVTTIKNNKLESNIESYTVRQEKLQIVNTISFEGRRGTGKTSAMMSFCRELEEKKEGKKHPFIVLDYIDASALEKGESILEIVLANMYHKLEEYTQKSAGSAQFDNKTRKILRKFEEIFTAINFIGERKDRSGKRVDVSPLSGLERLSNSQKLKKQVYELVTEFASLNDSFDDAMLVIPIDDIDMCFQSEEPSVYGVMETLHRYLMIPKVVILLTYDYPELLSGCEKHFAQMYYKHDKLTEGQEKHISNAANRYLEKVLPTYARIHLPSQQKRDYSDQNNIQVCLENDNEHTDVNDYLETFGQFIPKDTKVLSLNPKKFAFLFKAANCGLFYDACGEKRHFIEPSDFRDMVHIVTMCKQLKTAYHKDKETEDDIVFKELFDDLYFRFARIQLNADEYERFNNYLKVNIERRSKDILRDISKELNATYLKNNGSVSATDQNKGDVSNDESCVDLNLSSNDENISMSKWTKIRFIGDGDRDSYSYGELLYGLYLASDRGAFRKPLICCLLESYTIMLTKLYRTVKRAELKTVTTGGAETIIYKPEEASLKLANKEAYDAYETIKGILGLSISSSWSNCFVPRIASSTHGRKQIVNTNYINVPLRTRSSNAGAIKFMYSDIEEYGWEFSPVNDEKPEVIIQTIEIMCMFFSDVFSDDNKEGCFKIQIVPQEEISSSDEEDPPITEAANDYKVDKKEKKIIFKFSRGCFNIMNFVKNLYMGEEFFYLLYNEEKMNLKAKLKEFGIENEDTIDTLISDHSLYRKFIEWKDNSDGFNGGRYVMPLYSFDMMYNIMKRQYLDVKPYNEYKIVDARGFLESLLKTYSGILAQLKNQDVFYFSFDEKSNKDVTNGYAKEDEKECLTLDENRRFFSKSFEKSPFIEYMLSIKKSMDGKEEDNRVRYLEDFFFDLATRAWMASDSDDPQK